MYNMKLLTISILLCLCCVLSACGTNGISGNLGTNVAQGSGETPLLTIETYAEYSSFVAETKLPENFVIFDDISHFGTFHHFVCLSDSRIGDYCSYMYSLIDESGTEISVYISSEVRESSSASKIITQEVDETNMRNLVSDISGTYSVGCLEYTYLKGNLLSISWEDDGVFYTLSGDTLSNYPDNAKTALAALMDIQGKEENDLAATLKNETDSHK